MKKRITVIFAAALLTFTLVSFTGCAGSSSGAVSEGSSGGKVDKKQQEKQLNETKSSAEEAVQRVYELEKQKEELQK